MAESQLPALPGLCQEDVSDKPVEADVGEEKNLRTMEPSKERLESEASECPITVLAFVPPGPGLRSAAL